MPTHHTPVHLAAAQAVAASAGVAAEDLKVEAPPRPELGDLAVGCFTIAKAAKKSPAQVATEIAAAFQPTELLASATAAGPFVNFRLDRTQTFKWLIDSALRGQLVPGAVGTGKTICIDYSSPNISKHLAYHHIRGTTIGHALVQIFRALGYKVVGINFLGDWGTTHGMLLAAYNIWGAEEPLDITKLNHLYVKFRDGMKTNPDLEQQGRLYFKKLEDGDPEVRALWQRFRDISWAEFEEVYKLLGIEFDEVRGESAYEPDMPGVFKELEHLITESEGARVVELEGEKNPILLKTKDGTTLYATRDVAAAKYRWNTFHPTRSLYVVDRGQALHFRQLFKLLLKAGHSWASVCEHVPYGLIRLGGKKTATRLGGVMLMRDVFKVAEAEVREVIARVNPTLAPEIVDQVAPQIGIGAVVFANLATQREKDIDFDLEKAVSLDGDSGPYIQYSHARCASIARKAGEKVTSIEGIDFTKLGHDAEWELAKKLLELPEIVVRAADNSEPHGVAHYLLQLAGEFSRWYTAGNGDPTLRVLVDDVPTRRARLALVAAVQATFATGLGLLGIAAPDQM
ncbi:MAG: arginine--tRNA ligase [Deltaproteobacteria bacterium]|nr:arginine--tRNA ligase [Deltaproteobacteria bacterium]